MAPNCLFARKSVALFQAIELAQGVERMVRRKLAQLKAAVELRDLAVSPETVSREPVTRERKSQHSIRISHAWQLCLVWRSHDVYDADLVRSIVLGNLVVAEKEVTCYRPFILAISCCRISRDRT